VEGGRVGVAECTYCAKRVVARGCPDRGCNRQKILTVSRSDGVWRCQRDPGHRLSSRICPSCQHLGVEQRDGWWQCQNKRHVFAVRPSCSTCKRSVAGFDQSRREWICELYGDVVKDPG
jgi:hypothetical protein